VISVVMVLTVALSACGGDGGGPADPGTGPELTDDVTGDTGEADAGGGPAAGEVPDACALLSNEELTSILGADPGTAVDESFDPKHRRICTYTSGLILAVEVAENWQGDASFGLIDNPSVEVEGIGEEAHWQDIGGGTSQFVALGSEYFVALTVNGDQETAERLGEAMIAAL
jgi:hypothetical protein